MEKVTESRKLYNSSFEIGVRILVLLDNLNPKETSIHKLMILDHLSLNTFDVGGPASLHAPIPNRGVQIYSRKELIAKAITLLISKDLIEMIPSKSGLQYGITINGSKYLTYFESKYFKNLKQKVIWTTNEFGEKSDKDLKDFVNKNLSKWGEEFMADGNYANQV